MAKSYEELKEEISTITNEVEDGANTANRIGSAMNDIVDYAKESLEAQEERINEETDIKISGLVVQEGGTSETAVMSQKAVSGKLAELESESGANDIISGVQLIDITQQVKTIYKSNYLVDNKGVEISLEGGYISKSLFLEKGNVISFAARGSLYTATISKTNENNSFYTPVLIGVGSGADVPYQPFVYEITQDGYYAISWYKTISEVSLKKHRLFLEIQESNKSWIDAIAEIYINPQYLKYTIELAILRYQNCLYILGNNAKGAETWWAKTDETTYMNNGEIYPIISTSEGSLDYEVTKSGVTLGYVVFKNVGFFTGNVTNAKNKLNTKIVSSWTYNPIIKNEIEGSMPIIDARIKAIEATLGMTSENIQGLILANAEKDVLIDNTGNKIELEGGYVSMPEYLHEGDILCFEARGSLYTATISKTDESGSSYTPVLIGVGSGSAVPYQPFYFKVPENGYYAFSWFEKISTIFKINYNEKDKGESFNLLSFYDKFICCGDSLTYSQVSTSKTEYRTAKKIYPNILANLCGASAETYAIPGYTPKQWWEKYKSNLTKRDNCLYIVYLGTNKGLTDTIDADCPTSSLPDNYADTQTGYYGRILKTIYDLGEKALLVKINGVNYADTTNNVIEQFGARFNFPVVDNAYIEEIEYRYYPDGSGYDDLHLNDMGYAYFADRLIKDIYNMTSSMKKRFVTL